MTTDHRVREGECLFSIAKRHGFLTETIWEHADNADLKERRGDGSQLVPGDVVHIPDPRPKDHTAAGGQRHRFRRKGIPKIFRIQLQDGGQTLADLDCRLEIDGELHEVTSDADGWIEHPIEPDSKIAKVILAEGLTFRIRLGRLDPVEQLTGVQSRLRNLGYYRGRIHGEADERTRNAITTFQQSEGLEATGTADADTRDRLVERCGA